MIIVVLNHVATELNDQNFAEHEADIRTAALTSSYAASVDRILAEAGQWARAWEQQPTENVTFDGFPALIDGVADFFILPPGVAANAGETFAEAMVTFKQGWVDVSHDNTEAGQHSDSLDRRTDALSHSFTAINSNSRTAKATWILLPGADTITKKFLANGYSCHNNATRDVRPIFEETDFESVLGDASARTPFLRYLGRRWHVLAFSA